VQAQHFVHALPSVSQAQRSSSQSFILEACFVQELYAQLQQQQQHSHAMVVIDIHGTDLFDSSLSWNLCRTL
jgi:hypothetical protein